MICYYVPCCANIGDSAHQGGPTSLFCRTVFYPGCQVDPTHCSLGKKFKTLHNNTFRACQLGVCFWFYATLHSCEEPCCGNCICSVLCVFCLQFCDTLIVFVSPPYKGQQEVPQISLMMMMMMIIQKI